MSRLSYLRVSVGCDVERMAYSKYGPARALKREDLVWFSRVVAGLMRVAFI